MSVNFELQYPSSTLDSGGLRLLWRGWDLEGSFQLSLKLMRSEFFLRHLPCCHHIGGTLQGLTSVQSSWPSGVPFLLLGNKFRLLCLHPCDLLFRHAARDKCGRRISFSIGSVLAVHSRTRLTLYPSTSRYQLPNDARSFLATCTGSGEAVTKSASVVDSVSLCLLVKMVWEFLFLDSLSITHARQTILTHSWSFSRHSLHARRAGWTNLCLPEHSLHTSPWLIQFGQTDWQWPWPLMTAPWNAILLSFKQERQVCTQLLTALIDCSNWSSPLTSLGRKWTPTGIAIFPSSVSTQRQCPFLTRIFFNSSVVGEGLSLVNCKPTGLLHQ